MAMRRNPVGHNSARSFGWAPNTPRLSSTSARSPIAWSPTEEVSPDSDTRCKRISEHLEQVDVPHLVSRSLVEAAGAPVRREQLDPDHIAVALTKVLLESIQNCPTEAPSASARIHIELCDPARATRGHLDELTPRSIVQARNPEPLDPTTGLRHEHLAGLREHDLYAGLAIPIGPD